MFAIPPPGLCPKSCRLAKPRAIAAPKSAKNITPKSIRLLLLDDLLPVGIGRLDCFFSCAWCRRHEMFIDANMIFESVEPIHGRQNIPLLYLALSRYLI